MGRISRDERIGGDNRLLAELVSMWIDCIPAKPHLLSAEAKAEMKEQENFVKSIIRSRFISKAGSVFLRADEKDLPVAKIEKEATALERAAIDEMIGWGDSAAVQSND